MSAQISDLLAGLLIGARISQLYLLAGIASERVQKMVKNPSPFYRVFSNNPAEIWSSVSIQY